jgi:hypothetical protein
MSQSIKKKKKFDLFFLAILFFFGFFALYQTLKHEEMLFNSQFKMIN